jgi:hypothetical protein
MSTKPTSRPFNIEGEVGSAIRLLFDGLTDSQNAISKLAQNHSNTVQNVSLIQAIVQQVGSTATAITVLKQVHLWLDAYNSITGQFTSSQPASTDLSDSQAMARYAYVNVTTANYAMTTADRIVGINYAAPVSITLPDAMQMTPGTMIVVKDESGAADTNNITLMPVAGQTIEGAATQVLNVGYDVRRMYSNGSSWFLF